MDNLELWLTGPIPSKKNSKRIVRAGSYPKLVSSKDYLTWEKSALYELANYKPRHPLYQGEKITLSFEVTDNRRRDLTNMAEGVMDSLVKAGILEDDNWQNTGLISLECEKTKRSGVQIRMEGFSCSQKS